MSQLLKEKNLFLTEKKGRRNLKEKRNFNVIKLKNVYLIKNN